MSPHTKNKTMPDKLWVVPDFLEEDRNLLRFLSRKTNFFPEMAYKSYDLENQTRLGTILSSQTSHTEEQTLEL
jgi:hypothetical protein